MALFSSFGGNLSYTDVLQLDGAFSAVHINYDKSPLFGGCDGRELAKDPRLGSLSEAEHIDDVLGCIREFYGTENNCKMQDRIILWKHYWLEYINAFDVLTSTLPDSVVTAFVGRQSVELGIKYLLLVRTGKPLLGHELGKLSRALLGRPSETDCDYLDYVVEFYEEYRGYIEGRHPETIGFPTIAATSSLRETAWTLGGFHTTSP